MARTKHKARDNEVTDREQYATLVQSRLWRGRNLHILLNQRKGRKKNASKYEVLLANALLVQRVQIVSKGGGGCKAHFDQVHVKFWPESWLQASDDRNKLRAQGEKCRGGAACQKTAAFQPEEVRRSFETEYSGKRPTMNRPRMFSSCSNECRCHAVCTLRFSRAPPIALFTPIFATQPRSL